MAEAWSVRLEPESLVNETRQGRNEGGLRVLVVNSDTSHEVARVGFVRSNSRNPDTTFEDQLEMEIDKAKLAAERLNELDDEYDRIRAEEEDRAKVTVREILGRSAPASARPV